AHVHDDVREARLGKSMPQEECILSAIFAKQDQRWAAHIVARSRRPLSDRVFSYLIIRSMSTYYFPLFSACGCHRWGAGSGVCSCDGAFVSIPSSDRAMVRAQVWIANRAAAAWLAGDSIGGSYTDCCAHRLGQDLGGLLCGTGFVISGWSRGEAHGRNTDRLCFAAQSAEQRHS